MVLRGWKEGGEGMRLIDADAFLMDSIKEKQFFICREDALNDIFVIATVYRDLKKALANTPTIDAVEVVRCKDCRHTVHSRIYPEVLICTLTKMCGETDPEFFCANGEREARE